MRLPSGNGTFRADTAWVAAPRIRLQAWECLTCGHAIYPPPRGNKNPSRSADHKYRTHALTRIAATRPDPAIAFDPHMSHKSYERVRDIAASRIACLSGLPSSSRHLSFPGCFDRDAKALAEVDLVGSMIMNCGTERRYSVLCCGLRILKQIEVANRISVSQAGAVFVSDDVDRIAFHCRFPLNSDHETNVYQVYMIVNKKNQNHASKILSAAVIAAS